MDFCSKYNGINTLFVTPSANILLKRFGNLNANINASDNKEAPRKLAKSMSLKSPEILDTNIFDEILNKFEILIIKII